MNECQQNMHSQINEYKVYGLAERCFLIVAVHFLGMKNARGMGVISSTHPHGIPSPLVFSFDVSPHHNATPPPELHNSVQSRPRR